MRSENEYSMENWRIRYAIVIPKDDSCDHLTTDFSSSSGILFSDEGARLGEKNSSTAMLSFLNLSAVVTSQGGHLVAQSLADCACL